jgi:hypothetical protein
MRFSSLCVTVRFCALMTACAGYSPGKNIVGKDRAAVIALMGAPTAEHKIPQGTRLVYSRGPYGEHTYFVDFDQYGFVAGWKQVLTEENFKRITPGKTGAEVETLIGPSFIKTGLARNRGEVWAYRFETPFCIWFEIELSAEGLVRSTGYGLPPECRRKDTSFPGALLNMAGPPGHYFQMFTARNRRIQESESVKEAPFQFLDATL